MECYRLFYWPQIPGRGEFIRLAFQYKNVAFEEINAIDNLQQLTSPQSDLANHPPHFAVPILEVTKDNDTFMLSQTPVILAYLARKFGLDSEQANVNKEVTRCHVQQLTLTALDWANEAHNVHHPCGPTLFYEDQKQAAAEAAKAFRNDRIPKFVRYFEKAITSNSSLTHSCRLIGDKTSMADLVLFQTLEGLYFAFPHAMQKSIAANSVLLQFRQEMAQELQDYLHSADRRPFNDGLFRHYPELDPP
ncbi:glutathione transferase [Malassezia yamatoensis]|uniref:Glutathione transferase n=1 Tax=Malassezia yamatoensis TaxID=253288 RepID=A0AAJ5YQY5_9BASI|nr:glutathione transferase [Malassezia yamatoensis]